MEMAFEEGLVAQNGLNTRLLLVETMPLTWLYPCLSQNRNM